MSPLKFIRIRVDSPPWITQEVIELINDKSMIYKVAKTTGTHEDIVSARRARNMVNRFIKSAKSNYIKEKLHQHKNDPKQFWQILNDTLLKDNRNSSHTTFDKGDGKYTGIDDACEFINDHFANIGDRLHNQFKDTVVLDSFNAMYDIQTAEYDIDLTFEDVFSLTKKYKCI